MGFRYDADVVGASANSLRLRWYEEVMVWVFESNGALGGGFISCIAWDRAHRCSWKDLSEHFGEAERFHRLTAQVTGSLVHSQCGDFEYVVNDDFGAHCGPMESGHRNRQELVSVAAQLLAAYFWDHCHLFHVLEPHLLGIGGGEWVKIIRECGRTNDHFWALAGFPYEYLSLRDRS